MRISTKLIRDGGVIRLPGRFHVEVKVLGKGDASDEIDAYSLAEYEQDTRTIFLRRSRTRRQRRADLEHELLHMLVDWQDHFMRKVKC